MCQLFHTLPSRTVCRGLTRRLRAAGKQIELEVGGLLRLGLLDQLRQHVQLVQPSSRGCGLLQCFDKISGFHEQQVGTHPSH